MPLNYLNSGPEDVYALNRLGSTFSDMVIGLQQNRMRQQQFLAQQAFGQARLQLERQQQQSNELTAREERKKIGAEVLKLGADTERSQAEAGEAKTRSRSMAQIGASGEILGRDLEQLSTAEPGMAMQRALIANIARQGGQIAATHPANIGQQISELMSLNDPIIRNLIFTGTPMIGNVAPGASAVDYRTGQPIFTSPPRLSLNNDPRLLNARIAHEYATGAGALRRGNYGQDTPESSEMIQQAVQAMRGGDSAKQARVKVKDKTGKLFTVPAEQLDQAKQEGYEPAE